ncbi:MAG: DUF115 domain-containing protein [Magnetococcales bacterium]|nr:DUF115 domain-containing protein [Magnetococcales bacterium]
MIQANTEEADYYQELNQQQHLNQAGLQNRNGEAFDIGPTLTNRFGERYLPGVNGEIFSLAGTDSFYQRHMGERMQEKSRLYLVPGTDGGLLIHWLLKKGTAESSKYIFIELPEIIERLKKDRLLPDPLPDNVALETSTSWLERAQKFNFKDYYYTEGVRAIKSLAVLDRTHPGYAPLLASFEQLLGQMKMAMGFETNNRIFMLKAIENLGENRTSVQCLDNVFKGKTAIIMAGGPSLDLFYPWILANRENLVVMAVSRIAAQLQKKGIVPDMMFAIDPHDVIFHQSKQMLDFYEHTLLVNKYHLNPTLLGQWRGRNLFMGLIFPWANPLNPEDRDIPGITVAHQAIGTALDMGFSQLIVAGLDLCFSKEGFTHSKGSAEMALGPYSLQTDIWVETNDGGKAETTPAFLNALPSLAKLGKKGEEVGCQVINPAPGAAKADHVAYIPLDEIALEPITPSVWHILQQHIPEDSSESRLGHYQAVEQELNNIRKQLTSIKKLTDEALSCNAKMFGSKGRAPNYKFKLRMDKIEETLNQKHAAISTQVKNWYLNAFLKLSRPDKEKEWSDEEIKAAGAFYYQVYQKSTLDMLKHIDSARQRIRARMEEEKPKPNLKLLLSQWEKDDQPGRLRRFFDQRGETIADQPQHLAAKLAQLEERFQDKLAATNTNYADYIRDHIASPRSIAAKAKTFFRRKERDRLNAFLAGVQACEIDDKNQFLALIRGYLAELDGERKNAIRHFQEVDHELIQMDSLRSILSLSLRQKDLVTAREAAEKLSRMSQLFTPFYGDLLRLTGDKEQALEIYRGYVEIAEEDFVTRQKLGRLHMELGHMDQARETFSAILQADPHNKAAQAHMKELAQLEG